MVACLCRGLSLLGYTELELCSRGTGYQFIHAADMMYCAENHIRSTLAQMTVGISPGGPCLSNAFNLFLFVCFISGQFQEFPNKQKADYAIIVNIVK